MGGGEKVKSKTKRARERTIPQVGLRRGDTSRVRERVPGGGEKKKGRKKPPPDALSSPRGSVRTNFQDRTRTKSNKKKVFFKRTKGCFVKVLSKDIKGKGKKSKGGGKTRRTPSLSLSTIRGDWEKKG